MMTRDDYDETRGNRGEGRGRGRGERRGGPEGRGRRGGWQVADRWNGWGGMWMMIPGLLVIGGIVAALVWGAGSNATAV